MRWRRARIPMCTLVLGVIAMAPAMVATAGAVTARAVDTSGNKTIVIGSTKASFSRAW